MIKVTQQGQTCRQSLTVSATAVQPLPQSAAAAAGAPQHDINCRSHRVLSGICFAAECQAGPSQSPNICPRSAISCIMRQKQHPISITNQLLRLRVLASVSLTTCNQPSRKSKLSLPAGVDNVKGPSGAWGKLPSMHMHMHMHHQPAHTHAGPPNPAQLPSLTKHTNLWCRCVCVPMSQERSSCAPVLTPRPRPTHRTTHTHIYPQQQRLGGT